MFGTVHKVMNKSIKPAIWTELEAVALVPAGVKKLENDMMQFGMTNNSNAFNLVVDIPRLLDFEILLQYSKHT